VKKAYKATALLLILALFLSLSAILLSDALTLLLRHRREQRYLPTARQAAEEFDVPLSLVLAVIRTESNFRPRVVSDAGAVGLMQILPETFSDIGARLLAEPTVESDLLSPEINIRYGTCYLAYLYRQFGDWETALVAYNAGEGRVREWLSDPLLSIGGRLTAIPYPETARYVQSVTNALAYYRDKYNLQEYKK
jgi:soluble lytic murein transglycosylase